nr:immunoglobulin heavy chain junction region [Macaca mulatta]
CVRYPYWGDYFNNYFDYW